jgi:hypothetical protein
MEGLALAYVTCDKYSHVWDEWYDQFYKLWDLEFHKYFLGEQDICPFLDFEQIYHDRVDADKWTTKLRAQIEDIPEENIFIWLDDLIPQKNISKQFTALYRWFMDNGADALRIMGRGSASRYIYRDMVWDSPIYQLKKGSPYLVSFSPNIWKKSFLLEVLQWDESPWSAELQGSRRIKDWNRKIYAHHIDGWYINKIVQ